MARHLFKAALIGVLLSVSGCSSSPIDSGEPAATESAVGSVSLPLTTTVGDTSYRLNLATFTISGPALAKPRIVKPPADEPVHTEQLPVGTYSIQLEKGWVLEKLGPGAKVYVAVPAQLVTPNPVTFDVTTKTVADAFFGFVTSGGDVTLGGSVNIRIGVQDCSAYDSITAALGTLTADCLGTVDPRSYEVSKDGLLRPTFDSCPLDKSRFSKIKQLLSLQQRTARLPFAKQCLGARFAEYQSQFAQSGVNVCPTWKKVRIVNPITLDTIVKFEGNLPDLPAPDTGPLRGIETLKENAFYNVSLDAQGQKCETPAACAAVCAGGFPGFVVSAQGANSVLTDPVAWLTDNVYPGSSSDPYLRVTYYHPMSYYGNVPGQIFADYARYEPCGPNVSCAPERCSYWAGSHTKTRLQRDCLDNSDVDTCVAYCGPPLP